MPDLKLPDDGELPTVCLTCVLKGNNPGYESGLAGHVRGRVKTTTLVRDLYQ